MDAFWPNKHRENGVLWKFWKCPKLDQGRKRAGASPVLNWNDPADLETINDLILRKVFPKIPDIQDFILSLNFSLLPLAPPGFVYFLSSEPISTYI